MKAPLNLDISASRGVLIPFLEGSEVAIILRIDAHLGFYTRIFVSVCMIIKRAVVGGSWALKVAHVDVPKGLVDPWLLHLVSHLDTNSLRCASIGVVVDHREPIL